MLLRISHLEPSSKLSRHVLFQLNFEASGSLGLRRARDCWLGIEHRKDSCERQRRPDKMPGGPLRLDELACIVRALH